MEEENKVVLALPPPPSGVERTGLVVGGASVTMDLLGPVVVNEDGTLCRISNWHVSPHQLRVFASPDYDACQGCYDAGGASQHAENHFCAK
jgi:hypothetical protein